MANRWDPPFFDKAMILKYDMPGPRYTSYPTAPHFNESFGAGAYAEVIEETNADSNPPPLSLYFHLPFCRFVCYFCGCNVAYTKDRTLGSLYVDYVLKEVEAVTHRLRPGRKVAQIHWGGGTPTFISVKVLDRLWQGITARFDIDKDAEIGVELDPREVTEGHLEFFARAGFNRISIGVQDFDPEVQKAVHRIQSEELTRSVFNRCRELGFESINVDLIYGLPYQTTERFRKTVEKIIDMKPDRIANFNFAYIPEMIGHQKAIPREALPSPGEKLSILEMVASSFIEAGYVFVGMDHFTRPEDELCTALKNRTLYRNFQGYTTKAGCDLYGFGVTSISQVGPCYAQNVKVLKEYQKRVGEKGLAVFRGVLLTEEDILRRDVINRLMCHFVVYKKEVEKRYEIVFDDHFAEALKALRPMEEDGLLLLSDDRIEVSPLGRLLARNIAMAFDAYLGGNGGERFSRTV